MVAYKKMYTLMCRAASDSLNILSHPLDDDSINSVRFLLQQALMGAENIYTKTASGDYPAEEQS